MKQALRSFFSVFLLLFMAAPVPAAAPPLRVCADPEDMPFSQRAGSPAGFYLDLADAVGRKLGRPVERVWTGGTEMRGVRLGFSQGRCDVYFGLPATADFHPPYLVLSKPFMREGYALVLPKGRVVRSLKGLKGQPVAVQHGTPAQILLAIHDIDMRTYRTPQRAMAALARGEAKLAFLWGPSAGYYNAELLRGAYEVRPVSANGLEWPVAAGVRKDDPALLGALNRALAELGPTLAALEERYGFPRGKAIVLPGLPGAEPAEAKGAGGGDAADDPPAGGAGQALGAGPAKTTGADPARSGAQDPQAAEGRDLFNSRCARCHGENADSPLAERSIPDLLGRIPAKERQSFFLTVVTNGEPSQGMPPWGGALSRSEMLKIFAFITTVRPQQR